MCVCCFSAVTGSSFELLLNKTLCSPCNRLNKINLTWLTGFPCSPADPASCLRISARHLLMGRITSELALSRGLYTCKIQTWHWMTALKDQRQAQALHFILIISSILLTLNQAVNLKLSLKLKQEIFLVDQWNLGKCKTLLGIDKPFSLVTLSEYRSGVKKETKQGVLIKPSSSLTILLSTPVSITKLTVSTDQNMSSDWLQDRKTLLPLFWYCVTGGQIPAWPGHTATGTSSPRLLLNLDAFLARRLQAQPTS